MTAWRPATLDWETPGHPLPDPTPGALIEVMMPIHGAAAIARRAVERVLTHTDLSRHRLRLIDDGSRDPAVDTLLAEATRQLPASALTVEQHPQARGFAATVNRAIAATGGDLVLLNSDAMVAAGWLDGLIAAAASRPDVASVTPFSNDATICSFPRPAASNRLPVGFDLDRLAELIRARSARRRPPIPVGVGFCLYLRRAALDRVGRFDADAFGAGYGEETDWCLRGLHHGLRHLLADDVFVEHLGGVSFAGARGARLRRAELRLRFGHPRFRPTIAAYLAADRAGTTPAAAARVPLLAALREAVAAPTAPTRPHARSSPPPAPLERVLHVVHGWASENPAGTEIYARDLCRHQAGWRTVRAHARSSDPARASGDAAELFDHGVAVRLVVNHFDQRSPLVRNAFDVPTMRRDLAATLADFRPQLVHVHHLAGHGASILRTLHAAGVPVLFQVQDWWTLCARANLCDRAGGACPGPTPRRCAACLPLTAIPPSALWSASLHRLRRALLRRLLALPDGFLAGSQAVLDDLLAAGLLPPDRPRFVRPYGVTMADQPWPERPAAAPSGPLRVGMMGALMPHKGALLALDALGRLPRDLVELSLWGNPQRAPRYAESVAARRSPGVRLLPVVPEAELATALAALDLLLVPSIGRESYGLLAREALAVGTPVLAARHSGLAEIGAEGDGVTYFAPGDAADLAAALERLAEDRGALATLAARRPDVKGAAEAAVEIEEIYRELLARRR